MTHLTGRVFARLQQYDALPTELKREVEALEKYLAATQRDVFSSHPTLKLKTVHGVKTDALLEKIEAWYKLHGKEFSQTHHRSLGHGHHGTTTAPGTATGKAHNAAHNVKEDVKHAVGKDTTYDQTHGTGHGVTRDHHGTGHGVTNDPHHGKVHNAAHNVKEDVKHAGGRDTTYDPNYDQTRGYAGTGTGADMGRNYDGTGYGMTDGPHHGKVHNAAHNVKEDVKHAGGRDTTYDPNYDQTRGYTGTATGTAAGTSHTTGMAGAGAPTGAGTTNSAAHGNNATHKQPVQKVVIEGHMGVHTPHAKELLDGLVLKGFVTPHKEPKPEKTGIATPSKPSAGIGAANPMSTGTSRIDDLELTGSTLLVARAPSIADEKTKKNGPSVWDVVDGAVFAGMVNRKAGLIEKVIHGKETYVVVNERLHSLTLFKSDVSRKSITQLFNRGLQVAFDDSHAEHGQSHGVKVWNGADSEVLFTATQQERDALARALVQIGASQNGVRGIDGATTATGMKGKAEKMGHDVKHAVGADRPHHHDEQYGHTAAHKTAAGDHVSHATPSSTHPGATTGTAMGTSTAGQPYNQSYNTDKHVGEGIMGGEHRGHHSPTMTTDTRSATHTSTGDAQYQQPSHHHGMEKLGLGDHHHQQQQYQQQQYQQNPQHGMTADNAHVKRDVGESRGYTQVNEPTVAP